MLFLAACTKQSPETPEEEKGHGELYSLPAQSQLSPLFEGEGDTSVVVSLTFDDGFASQELFLDILNSHEIDTLHATFFVNTSRLNLEINERDSRDHVRYAPLDTWMAAARAGHEIASHTVAHPDLSCTPERFDEGACQLGHEPIQPAERERQICADREMLLSLGFDVTGFAYPFGRDRTSPDDRTIHELVENCGFSYARGVRGLTRGNDDESTLPKAETVPPSNTFAIRSYTSLTADIGFKELRALILDVREEGGGWVPLILHNVSEDCADPQNEGAQLGVCTLREELEKLVLWLSRSSSDDAAPEDVATRTIGQVMSEVGSISRHEVANGSLDERHSGSIARANCFDRFQGKHEDNFRWTATAGDNADESVDAGASQASLLSSSDHFEKLFPTASHPTPVLQMTTRDDGCYLPVAPGGSYQLRVNARSADEGDVRGRFVVKILRVLEVDGGAEPTWATWEFDKPPIAVLSPEWKVQHLNLPPIPSGVVAIAFGFQYLAPSAEDGGGEIWVDDFELYQYR